MSTSDNTISPFDRRAFSYRRAVILAVLLAAVSTALMMAPCSDADPDYSGDLNSDVSWEINGTELTIYGTGATGDLAPYAAPWKDIRVESIVVEGGITEIGAYMFYDMHYLQSVSLPDTIKSIGDYAFRLSRILPSISIPDSVEEIGTGALYNCLAMEHVYLGKIRSLDSIKTLNALKSVEFSPDNLTYTSIDGMVYSVTKKTLYYVPPAYRGDLVLSSTTLVVDKSACEGRSGITSLVIPDSVTTIRAKAFNNCSSISTVSFGDSVRIIYEEAFRDCSIESVSLPDTLKSIGDYAFYGNSIADVVLPDSVTSLGVSAFGEGLKTIYLGMVRSLDAIRDIETLESVSVSSSNLSYRSSGGMVYSPTKKTVIFAPLALQGDVKLLSTVTVIGEKAFYHCEKIDSITLSSRVKTIKPYAFSYCSVKSLVLPDTVTTVGDQAFENSGLESLVIGNSVSSLYEGVFYGLNLKHLEIGDSITEINYGMGFEYTLESLVIGDGVTVIPGSLFCGFENLKSVTLGSSVTTISAEAFAYTPLETLVLSDSVKKIGVNAFYGTNLTSVTIPAAVYYLPVSAFGECTELTEFVVDSDNSTYSSKNNVFYNKAKTRLIKCFNPDITSITIPSTVTSIDTEAFKDCSKLTKVVISSKVKKIGELAFSGCNSITSLTIDSSNPYYKSTGRVIYSKDGTTLYSVTGTVKNFTIPSTVRTVADNAFYGSGVVNVKVSSKASLSGFSCSTDSASGTMFNGCMSLESIEVNSANTEFASFNGALYSKDGSVLYQIPLGADSFVVLDSVTVVSDDACELPLYDSSGNEISSSDIVGMKLFKGNDGFYEERELLIGSPIEVDSARYEVKSLDPCMVALTSVDSSVTEFTVPSSIDFLYYHFAVDEISYNAFSNSDLVSVEISNGVSTIGDYAFSGCSSLTSVSIPDSVTSMGDSVFGDCYSLESITIPDSVTSMGDYAFNCCSSLTSVSIPDSITSIGDYIFRECSSLESITIPDSVTSIGNYAFEDCSSLASVSIPDSVTSIGPSAFGNCSSLTSVNLPSGLTLIDACTFEGCESLKGLTIPDSVTEIGDCAFYDAGLSSLYIPDSVTKLGCSVIDSDGAGQLYISKNLSYMDDDAFSSILFKDGDTSLENTVESLAGWGYDFVDGEYVRLNVNLNDRFSFGGLSYKVVSVEPLQASVIGYSGKPVDLVIPEAATYNYQAIPVVSIGTKVFYGCTTLKTADLGSVSEVGVKAFANCTALTTLDLGDSAETLKAYAFYGCSKLTSVNFMDSAKTLREYASYSFYKCSKLTSVVIPSYLETIGTKVFYPLVFANAKGTTLTVSQANLASLVGYEYVSTDGKMVRQSGPVLGKEYTSGKIVYRVIASLPAELEVVGLNTDVTRITIPAARTFGGTVYDVVKIGDSAFEGRVNLTVISMNGIETLGAKAFYGCTALKIVGMTGTKDIGTKAFANCTALVDPRLGDGLENIGPYAFYRCSALKEVDFGESLETIGPRAFTHSAIEEAILPSCIESIGTYAFYNCASLAVVDMSGSTASIDIAAFASCSALTKIAMPETITELGSKAFNGTKFIDGDLKTMSHTAEGLSGGTFTGSSRVLCLPLNYYDVSVVYECNGTVLTTAETVTMAVGVELTREIDYGLLTIYASDGFTLTSSEVQSITVGPDSTKIRFVFEHEDLSVILRDDDSGVTEAYSKVPYGSSYSYTMTAESGKVIGFDLGDGMSMRYAPYDDGMVTLSNSGDDYTISIRSVTSDVAVSYLCASMCTVTIEADGSGTVSESSLTVPEGTIITYSGNVLYVGSIEVTAVASRGYVFDYWDYIGGVWGDVAVHAVFSSV